ncbi:MAG: hypothetical protein PHX08_16495 [Lachnospiraceae bacterium]|nr:hypothetical protein [Lachnospiraceae bacterium]
MDEINNHEVKFISTDLRAEFIENISYKIAEFGTDSWNNQRGILEVFTHEWIINDKVKGNVEALCSYAKENGYEMKFYEDVDDF